MDFGNPYGVLEVNKDANDSEIKRSFQRLVKKYHPDRLPPDVTSTERDIATQQFHKVTQAYDILSDVNQKLDCDKKLNAESITQQWPVSDILNLDDMTFDPTKECYESPCRCGGRYIVGLSDLEDSVEVVCCSMCSLSIKLLYQDQVE